MPKPQPILGNTESIQYEQLQVLELRFFILAPEALPIFDPTCMSNSFYDAFFRVSPPSPLYHYTHSHIYTMARNRWPFITHIYNEGT